MELSKEIKSKSVSVTSWSYAELFELSNRDNHKIVKDSVGEYRWMHYLNGKWEMHSIKVFEDCATPSSWLHFWMAKWSTELKERTQKKSSEQAKITRKVRVIINSLKRSTSDKIRQINNLQPNFTQQDIANELEVSVKTVTRALK
jgi:hypothetical protein